MDQISHTLNCWKRLSSLLSYRGRVLIINNLAASKLWHRMIALQPPKSLILNLQRILVNFFWNGMHRLRADLLSVPLEKGGQGLVDITSKILSFRLTTLRQLLYKEVLSWRPLASCLLLQAGKLKCGLELVLLDLQRVDTSLLPSFYQSLLNASQCLLPVRNKDSYKFSNFMREPVFYNSLFHHDFQSRSLIQSFIESGFFLVEDFVNHTYSEWQTPNQILEACNVKSTRIIGLILRSIVKVFNLFNLSWPPSHDVQGASTTQPDFPDFVFSNAPFHQGSTNMYKDCYVCVMSQCYYLCQPQ